MSGRHDGTADHPRSRGRAANRGLDPDEPTRRPLVARLDPVAHLDRPSSLAPRRVRGSAEGAGRPSAWSAAGAVTLAAVAALVGGLVVTATTGPAPGTVLASDAMSRTVDGSWGDAPVGGTYALAASSSIADSTAADASVLDPASSTGTTADGTPAGDSATVAPAVGPAADPTTTTTAPVDPDTVFGVRGGVGIMTLARGTSATATLPDDDRLDVQAAAQFSVSALPTSGNGIFASLNLRDADSSSFQGRVRIGVGGRVFVSIIRQDGGPAHLTTLAGEVALPTRVTAEDPVRVEASVTGQDPVQLQIRAWQIDQPDGVVDLTATDATDHRLADAGAIAVWGYVSQGSADAELRVDDLSVVALAGGGTSVTTTNPTSASATDPTTDPTTTSATVDPTTTDPTTVDPTTTTPTTTDTTAPTTTDPTTDPTTTSATVDPTTTESTTTAPTTAATTAAPVTPPASSPPSTPPSTDAGAGPVGSARYPVPAGAYFVSTSGDDGASGSQSQPWRTVTAAATRAPAGATIVVRGGSYHERVVVPSGKRMTIQSYPGEAVWFDGSVPVTSWQSRGGTWVASGWTATFDTSQSFSRGSNAGGFVNPAHPMAADPQQLFVDGAQLVQVPTGVRPGPGQFSVDTGAGTLTIGSDPTGHAVRASDLTQAFLVAGPLTLRGVGVQRYATPLPMMGTVFFGGASGGSVVEDVVVVDNASQGISITQPDIMVRGVTASRNGMTGIHANNADRGSVVDSLVEGNNTQHFNRDPSSGGIKVTRTRGFTIDHNVVSDNLDVNGIWLDESVVDFVVSRNTVAGNGVSWSIGIELCASGVVAGNNVTDAQWGVALTDSGNVQIYNNHFSGIWTNDIRIRQDARREATSDGSNRDRRQPQPDLTVPWLTQDLTIANNVFDATTYGGSSYQVHAQDIQTGIPASSMRMEVTGNQFTSRYTGQDSWPIGWGNGDNRTWVSYGSVQAFQDAVGLGPNSEVAATGAAALSAARAAPSAAVPIPAAVAEVLQVPAGSRFLGPLG